MMDHKAWELFGPAQMILDIHEVGKYLGVSKSTLQRMIAAGQFPAGQIVGSKPTWTGADIAAYLHLRGRFGDPLEDEKEVQIESKRIKSKQVESNEPKP